MARQIASHRLLKWLCTSFVAATIALSVFNLYFTIYVIYLPHGLMVFEGEVWLLGPDPTCQSAFSHSGIELERAHATFVFRLPQRDYWGSGGVLGWKRRNPALVIPLWIILLAFAAPTAYLWRRSWRRGIPGKACASCGYDLTGNVSGVCPECGRPAIAAQGSSLRGPAFRVRTRLAATASALGLALYGLSWMCEPGLSLRRFRMASADGQLVCLMRNDQFRYTRSELVFQVDALYDFKAENLPPLWVGTYANGPERLDLRLPLWIPLVELLVCTAVLARRDAYRRKTRSAARTGDGELVI